MRQGPSTSLSTRGISTIRAHEARAEHKRECARGITTIRAHEARAEHKGHYQNKGT
jgi:hypothetical protein